MLGMGTFQRGVEWVVTLKLLNCLFLSHGNKVQRATGHKSTGGGHEEQEHRISLFRFYSFYFFISEHAGPLVNWKGYWQSVNKHNF